MSGNRPIRIEKRLERSYIRSIVSDPKRTANQSAPPRSGC
nr:MAG TPA: hypothetical protein [Caudoviricetes sp.]